MKTMHKFGYLFAIVAVSSLFACNGNEIEDEKVVNDSPFVGTWNVKDWNIGVTYEVLDSLNQPTGQKREGTVVISPTTNDVIEFKEDYTALRSYNQDNGPRLDAYKWKDLGEELVLTSFQTYQKTAIDTFAVKKSGSEVVLTAQRKAKAVIKLPEDYYDVENDTTYTVFKNYNADEYTDITVTLAK